jgi:putative isomerase
MNYLVHKGLSNPAYSNISDVVEVRQNLVLQGLSMLRKTWESHGHVHENYNSITGEGCDVESSDPFYHWGALPAYIAIIDNN